jgi:hypothetical protein
VRRRTGAPPRPEPLLSFVSLGVADLGRARRFYRMALGLAPEKRSRGMALLALGSIRLALLPRAALAREAGLPRRAGSAASPRPASAGVRGADGFGLVLLSLNVDRREAVAGLLRRAAAAGGRVVRKEAPASWGGETGVFADPDGFLWEVAWNPRFSFAASGRRRGSPRPARRSR